mgnify:CR=1 FL=1
MNELLHKDLSYAIIGAAMEVHNELHPGLHEKLYEKALIIELESKGLKVETQKQFPVHYKGTPIGTLVPDLIVNGLIIVETKAVDQFHPSHYAQLKGYLKISKLDLGILLNFNNPSLQHDRYVIGSIPSPPRLQS